MEIKKITIFYDNSLYTHRWLKAILNVRKELKELGYKVKYKNIWNYYPVFRGGKIREKIERDTLKRASKSKHDIVMMAFHHSTSWLCSVASAEERGKILKEIKEYSNKLIWLDTADSTGTCMFDVMPYVDLYLKKQILKDRNLYTKDFYGSRIFCEYYHNKTGIIDEELEKRYYPPLDPKYINKLGLSWNVGLGDLFISAKKLLFNPFKITKPNFTPPNSMKNLDIQYRGSSFSPIGGYQRRKSKELLTSLSNVTFSDANKRIPKNEYIKEGLNAKSILSPFGWGEICGRDFEAITYGACLIKHSMDHLDTYPNVYYDNDTYVPLKWDFSDFKEKLEKANSQEYKKISYQAQDSYKFFFTKEGKEHFANHIVSQIEKV